MKNRVAILMYHRVCGRGDDTACYFARGTAVTPENFAIQMAFLAENTDVVSLQRLTDTKVNRLGDRPVVVLTFDDGYADVHDRVWPVCDRLGLPFSVFPIAGHTAESSTLCWVDWYYAILHRAQRRGGVDLGPIVSDSAWHAPAIDDDVRWWVRGPVKEKLHGASPSRRTRFLHALATTLAADVDGRLLSSQLYLGHDELRSMAAAGVVVGGHGVHHVRLRDCDPQERDAEIEGSRKLLDAIAPQRPYWFCYPDGSHDELVASRVAAAGFVGALTVEPGHVHPKTSRLALPRFLVRDAPPTVPGWCAGLWGAQL